jgi:3-oxoacyl-[acyl-carrier protein] reductase
MNLDLAGKRALLIGGGDEIDQSILLALLQQGVTVAITYPYEDEAAATIITELERQKNGSFALQLKASDAQGVARMVELVRQKFGQLDIVVNNASLISHASIQELTLPQWQQTLDENLTSIYLVTQAVLDILTPGASIINVSACLAAVGMRGKAHYTAAKAGVIGFTRSICKELGAKGIRVNVVAPGVIGTGDMGNLSPEQRGRYAYLAALGRLGKTEEVAQTVLFLASALSSFITGATIPVDGGVGGIAAF